MSDVSVVGIIGAGQMGRGIAQVAARAGLEVRLLDAAPELAARAYARIGDDLGRLVERGKLSDHDRDELLSRIHPAEGYGDLGDAGFVIEAVVEDLATKEAVFAAADGAVAPSCVLASNTSALSITRLAAATRRPERVVGMHFMNPAPVMRLVELVRGLQTDDATVDATRAVAERMGKTIVMTRDMPGFVVNRLLTPLLNEACFALQEGLGSVEEIDRAALLGLNHPMGPFQLADLIGLDTVLEVAEVLHRELGDDKYRPAAILRNYVAAGWLGRKSGRGFYTYS